MGKLNHWFSTQINWLIGEKVFLIWTWVRFQTVIMRRFERSSVWICESFLSKSRWLYGGIIYLGLRAGLPILGMRYGNRDTRNSTLKWFKGCFLFDLQWPRRICFLRNLHLFNCIYSETWLRCVFLSKLKIIKSHPVNQY